MKRIAALLLALLLCLTPQAALAAAVPCLRLDTTTTTTDTAVITISLTNNPGFAACKLFLYWNTQYFSLSFYENTDGQGSLLGNDYNNSGYQFFLYSAINITGNGDLITLHLRVSSDTPNGYYPVMLAVSPKDCIKENGDTIAFTTLSGGITVDRDIGTGGGSEGGAGGSTSPYEPEPIKDTPNPLVCGGAALDCSRTLVLLGYGDGKPHEEDYLTRAQAATLIYRLLTPESLLITHSLYNTFTDVQTQQWFNEAVSTIANAGVVEGVGGGLFDPNSYLTWAQIVTIMSRFTAPQRIKLQSINVSGHWCEEYVQTAVFNGWLEDTAVFQPNALITRGDTVEYINNILATCGR